jgi:hypothetical protein
MSSGSIRKRKLMYFKNKKIDKNKNKNKKEPKI